MMPSPHNAPLVGLLDAALEAITVAESLGEARGIAHAALHREEYHGHEHLFCLAARLGGPEHPPFLCGRGKGHAGQHVASREGVEIWRWGSA